MSEIIDELHSVSEATRERLDRSDVNQDKEIHEVQAKNLKDWIRNQEVGKGYKQTPSEAEATDLGANPSFIADAQAKEVGEDLEENVDDAESDDFVSGSNQIRIDESDL